MSVNAIPQKSAIFRGLDGKTVLKGVNSLAFAGKTKKAAQRNPGPDHKRDGAR